MIRYDQQAKQSNTAKATKAAKNTRVSKALRAAPKVTYCEGGDRWPTRSGLTLPK